MNPTGIFHLQSSGVSAKDPQWTNLAMDGVRVRTDWKTLQPSGATSYDWSALDLACDLAGNNSKQLGVSVNACLGVPTWVHSAGAKVIFITSKGVPNQMLAIPWDKVFLVHYESFITALAARYDGRFTYVPMGGLGQSMESYIAHDDATVKKLDKLGGLEAWKGSCVAITDAYASSFKTTPFIFTAAKPYGPYGNVPASVAALSEVVNQLAAKYPGRFGVMDCSLAVGSNTGYLPHMLVSKWSASCPCGLQFLTSTVGFGGHDLGGTLKQALDAGVALKAHFIEVYQVDANDPANTQLFQDTSARLVK